MPRPIFIGRLAAAVAALLLAGAVAANPVAGQGTWQQTLHARDFNGDGSTDAFYDSTLNITWLNDTQAGAGTVYDSIGLPNDGAMFWFDAVAWAAQLTVHGISGWRLPTMLALYTHCGMDGNFQNGLDCGYNVRTISDDGQTVYSELAHLFYVTLGNLALCTPGLEACYTPQPGYGLSNTADFKNLAHGIYWLNVKPEAFELAWSFDTLGLQHTSGQGGGGRGFLALAVHPGDVGTAVPEPQSWLLWLAGLGALAGAGARRRRA